MNNSQEELKDDGSDDSDLGFYMPTIVSKSKNPSPEKQFGSKPKKITKTVRTKKKKTNTKRPPKSKSPDIRVPSPGKPVLSDNNRKSYTMSNDNAG